MTEPENFEDDLFADLYDDNDTTKAPPAPAVPAAESSKTENQSSAPTSNETTQQDHHMDQEGGDDDDEDDDDVDFNLGGRDNSNTVAATSHDTDASTPPYGTVHKASAKDDG